MVQKLWASMSATAPIAHGAIVPANFNIVPTPASAGAALVTVVPLVTEVNEPLFVGRLTDPAALKQSRHDCEVRQSRIIATTTTALRSAASPIIKTNTNGSTDHDARKPSK